MKVKAQLSMDWSSLKTVMISELLQALCCNKQHIMRIKDLNISRKIIDEHFPNIKNL